jgi:hypothetical protein
MLVTATTWPSPEAISLGSRAFVIRIVPSTFDSYICRHFSSSASASGSSPSAPPALLTRMSQCSMRATKASTEAGSVTSRAIASPSISPARASSRSSRRAPSTVRNPLAESALAVAAPMPLDAPVITAVLIVADPSA